MTSWLCPSRVLDDHNFLWGPYGGSLSTVSAATPSSRPEGEVGGHSASWGPLSAELELEWPQRLEAPVPNIREGFEVLPACIAR